MKGTAEKHIRAPLRDMIHPLFRTMSRLANVYLSSPSRVHAPPPHLHEISFNYTVRCSTIRRINSADKKVIFTWLYSVLWDDYRVLSLGSVSSRMEGWENLIRWIKGWMKNRNSGTLAANFVLSMISEKTSCLKLALLFNKEK